MERTVTKTIECRKSYSVIIKFKLFSFYHAKTNNTNNKILSTSIEIGFTNERNIKNNYLTPTKREN